MKILVVGSGGREHAIALKLKENPKVEQIFAAPGNGGMAVFCTPVNIKATDVDGMVAFAKENGVDFAVVAPDDPLVLGMVDAMEEAGIPSFGPNKAAAIIEGSKVFSKNLMKKYGIPTAKYETFASEVPTPPWSRPTAWPWAKACSLPKMSRRPWTPSTPS